LHGIVISGKRKKATAASKSRPKDHVVEEREVKIRLPRAALEDVFQALTKSAAVRKSVSHKYTPRTYFDTPDLQLYQNGISLRVQYTPGKGGEMGGYAQTVKFDMDKDAPAKPGLFFRKECEAPAPGACPDVALFTDVQAKKLLKPFKNKKMVALFTVAVERRCFNLTVGRGAKSGTVELAFDVGEMILHADNKRYPFSEIELEVMQGSTEAIEIFQEKIMALAPAARVQLYSKAQQGSRLHQKRLAGR
jgi:inorganic triphosphatase YgiF